MGVLKSGISDLGSFCKDFVKIKVKDAFKAKVKTLESRLLFMVSFFKLLVQFLRVFSFSTRFLTINAKINSVYTGVELQKS